jgi:hypothetical protein
VQHEPDLAPVIDVDVTTHGRLPGAADGYRLAQVAPAAANQLAPFELPVTISLQPVPCLTVEQATDRLGLLGQPFLFFIDAAQGRASVLYHRYDGHYGLITPAGD